MILHEKLEKPYDQCVIRDMIWLKCDYCGIEFQRVKKSIPRLNKNINKDSCGKTSCLSEKKKEIYNLLLQSPEFLTKQQESLQKQKENNIKKYGCEHYTQTDKFKKARKEKLIEKFGVESPLSNPEIQLKHQETCMKKYGVSNPSQIEGWYDKVIETNLEKYGFESSMSNEEVLKKRKKTSQEKYGKESYSQTEECVKRKKQTCQEKYGVEHTSELKENRDKAKKTCQERYGVSNFAKTEEFKKKFVQTCIEKYGVPNPLFLQKNQIYGKTQKEIQDWLNSFGFEFEKDYSILTDKEIDLYDKTKKIAIEYCGLFWHNEFSPSPRLKNYHFDKYKACKNLGIRLITIFEDEWKLRQEQCKSILKSILNLNKNKIFARKCKLIDLSKKTFNEFCSLNHLQGGNNLGFVFYGLEYQKELVGCMSLGRHHRNKNVLTLDRLCFKNDTQVIGGASKLFKACCNWAIENEYKKIISWSDNRWSEGSIYLTLGFSLEENLPADYSYVNYKKPTTRLSKQSQKKSNTNCPADKTEHEWSAENGLARIWDCGKIRWIYQL